MVEANVFGEAIFDVVAEKFGEVHVAGASYADKEVVVAGYDPG